MTEIIIVLLSLAVGAFAGFWIGRLVELDRRRHD